MKPKLKSVVEEFGYDGNMGEVVVCMNTIPFKHDRLHENFQCFAEFAYQSDPKMRHFACKNVINLIIVKNAALNPHYIDDFEFEKANYNTQLACLFCSNVVANVVEFPINSFVNKCIKFLNLYALPPRPNPQYGKHLNLPDQRDWGMKDLTRICFDSRQLCTFASVLTHNTPIPTRLYRTIRYGFYNTNNTNSFFFLHLCNFNVLFFKKILFI